MVKLRLARFGRKNVPFYRLVAIQAKTKRGGEAIEYIGTYDPKLEKNKLQIKEDRIKYWLSVGAQPTDTVHHLLAKEGFVKPLKKKYKKAPGKNAQAKLEGEKAKAEESKAAPAEEKKVEVEAASEVEAPQAETPATPEAPAEAPVETPAEEAKPE